MTSSVRFEPPRAADAGIGRIVIDRPDDAVNAVNPALVEALAEAVRAARAAVGLHGLIVVSGKTDQWVAGADLKLVVEACQAEDVARASRRFQAVLDELAWLPCTCVAALNGAALGGGFELALACDYRVAADSPAVSVGQPEVSLGLVPGGGGTQRLPRLVGLERGLDLILNGRRLNARRALRAGLIDEVVHPSVLEQAAAAWAARPKRALDRRLERGLGRRAALDLAEQTPPGRRLVYDQARRAVLARTRGHYPAPLEALEAVRAGFEHGVAAGLEVEARALGDLALTPTARHLIWLFLATQRQKRLVAGDARPVERMAVVGAGFMGAAIAEVGAAAGVAVRVRDVTPQAVASGLGRIRKLVERGVAGRRFERREGQAILQRVSGTTDATGLARTDLVVEAVFEQLDIKRGVVRDLEAVLRPEAIIASNTSALPIAEIARDSRHPQRIVGMHFFSPAERMPLLEVVRPDAAAEWAVQQAVSLGVRMGKTPIVVGDRPGFYTSRVLGVMLNEAATLLGEGARIEAVDAAMTAYGFPVGPFVVYDEVGLEVAQHAGETLVGAFGDRFSAAPVVPRLVAAGLTGRKAGRGFYVWHQPPNLAVPRLVTGAVRQVVHRPTRLPNPAVYALAAAPAPSTGRTAPAATALDQQAIQDRLVLLFINEAMRCLEEGVLRSPTDGDLGAVLGLGFPPFTGGPFHAADAIGLAALQARLDRLAAQHGSRYAPAGLLVEHARQGRAFYEE